VVAKVKERLAVSIQAAQKFDGERFIVKNLNEFEVRKQYQMEITNRYAAMRNLWDDKDTNRVWGDIKKNIKTSTN